MNAESEPVDPELRRHLARRSAGPLPAGLVSEIDAALHAVSVERPRSRIAARFPSRLPRAVTAAASLALVAVLALAAVVGFQRIGSGPAVAVPSSPETPAATQSSFPISLDVGTTPAIIGAGNLPMGWEELEMLMLASPDRLAGRVAILKSPIPSQITCQGDGGGGGCAVNTASLASGGDWAVYLGNDGRLSLLGPVARQSTGTFVFTLDTVAIGSRKQGDILLVDAWLLFAPPGCDAAATPMPSACNGSSLSPTNQDNQPDELPVQAGAYQAITGNAAYGPPVHGIFLTRVGAGGAASVLASVTASPS
jgi:hypothetical protein